LREAFIAIPAGRVECHGCHTMILLEALQIYPSTKTFQDRRTCHRDPALGWSPNRWAPRWCPCHASRHHLRSSDGYSSSPTSHKWSQGVQVQKQLGNYGNFIILHHS
jgi:hypothetical protein